MKKYQSEISQAVHQTISDLHEAGFCVNLIQPA